MGRHELTKTIVDYDKKDEENNKQEDNEGKSIVLNKCVFVGDALFFVSLLVRIFVFVCACLCELG